LIGHIFAASVRRATTGNINCRSIRPGKDIKMMKKKSKTIIMS
jgi:DNA-binding transcriptional regulator YdaS (Cro superfamily)